MDAGFKYFILGDFLSSLFLFGSFLIYGFTGSTNFEDFKDLFCCIFLETTDMVCFTLWDFQGKHFFGILFDFSFLQFALIFILISFFYYRWSFFIYGLLTFMKILLQVYFFSIPNAWRVLIEMVHEKVSQFIIWYLKKSIFLLFQYSLFLFYYAI